MINNDLRYVGDMLAWIHQSCPGEAESIHHLLRQVDKVDKRELETRIMTGATEGVSSYTMKMILMIVFKILMTSDNTNC